MLSKQAAFALAGVTAGTNFYNVTARKNAYSIYFQNDDGTINGYKLSIFGRTVITLSWNFKLGNYASE